MRNQLTQWSEFQFLCRDSKNHQHLDHDFNNYVCHCRSWCKDSSVYLKSAEEMFYAIKDIKYLLLASARIFSRLGTPVSIWFAQVKHEGYRPTGERRSPQRLHLPVEMPESICQGGNSPRQNVPIHTSPTPCPTIAENAYSTFTVGETHFVSLSSSFWGWLNAGIWSRRTVRMASGESQD